MEGLKLGNNPKINLKKKNKRENGLVGKYATNGA